MINLKLGLAAVVLELGAWTAPALLSSRSDNALLSYLLAHAVASVMLALFLFPFLARRRARPRLPMLALLATCSYAVPVVGFVGVVAAVFAMRYLRPEPTRAAFESIQLPEYDQHQRWHGNFRHAGLRTFLSNAQAPLSARLRAMVALQNLPGRTASPLLRTVLSDASEDLRLLAYGMLDSMEKSINSGIDTELDALRTNSLATATEAQRRAATESAHRLSDLYWELVYQELVQGDLRDHAISQSLQYCERVLALRPDNAQLHLRHGRLQQLLGLGDKAAKSYARSRAQGMPATRVLPFEAELSFQRGDFRNTRRLMLELKDLNALPRLQPVVDFWTAP